jgi:hypothetical protein
LWRLNANICTTLGTMIVAGAKEVLYELLLLLSKYISARYLWVTFQSLGFSMLSKWHGTFSLSLPLSPFCFPSPLPWPLLYLLHYPVSPTPIGFSIRKTQHWAVELLDYRRREKTGAHRSSSCAA